MLSNGAAGQPVRRVIGVGVLGRLILDAACVLLATEYGVALQRILVKQPLLVDVAEALGGDVQQLKGGPLPKVVARVH